MIPAPKLLPLLFPQYHAIPEVKIAMMLMMLMLMMMMVMMMMMMMIVTMNDDDDDDDDDCCGVACSYFDDKGDIQSF